MNDDYRLIDGIPSAADYRRLRESAGLRPKSAAAAERGLPNTLFGVSAMHGTSVVGMGRIIGDGGCFFEIVDIAVLPEHQRRGLGKKIMARLMEWIRINAPATALVSLLADANAGKLYEQFGFKESAPTSKGMVFRL
ncbi:MAG: GNAT family N-acetyltransferase [Elusimicrobiota bacterium]